MPLLVHDFRARDPSGNGESVSLAMSVPSHAAAKKAAVLSCSCVFVPNSSLQDLQVLLGWEDMSGKLGVQLVETLFFNMDFFKFIMANILCRFYMVVIDKFIFMLEELGVQLV